ncbi:hypothetical protein Cs7R123_57960 [Catellatospora sp. TT07R-123]|uniref:hypothetical protein n=1 Tax=Catellatospora sp. TT07R-123 TaxID=2733863 RepID=UPI001B03950B|nr:hypothetical protein [Catellatospora sp. TT07R-123]GHJ48454.1 hypothetical protein Cs7R123_57960 [Catellatospora sp. TT07R-123]
MDGGELRLDPDAAVRAGADLHDAADRMARLRDGAGERLATGGTAAPWGRDALGASFAANYDPNAGPVLQLWRDAAQQAALMGQQITRAARRTAEVDRAGAHRLDQAGGL